MDASALIPLPVWERIFQSSNISARDIVSVSSTCKLFREFLLQNGALWRIKFAQKWPDLAKEIGKGGTTTTTKEEWMEIYRRRSAFSPAVKNFLDDLSARYLHEESKYLSYTAYDPMSIFASRIDRGDLFLADELRRVLHDTPTNTGLTDKYYAIGALRFFTQQTLVPIWRQWLDSGAQLLEQGAWLFAKWFSPTSYLDDAALVAELNRMTEDTKRKLSEMDKRHPLFRVADPIDHENLRETMWPVLDTRKVIDALNIVFCTVHGYRGNEDDYYNTENSFLDKVISSKLGIPITLCILYHAVARRLGVYCSPVNFPGHFLLKFLDNPELSADDQKYTYIDVFNSCRLMREDQVCATHGGPALRRDRVHFEIPNSVEVLNRMVRNVSSIEPSQDVMLICSARELGVVLSPADFDVRLTLVQTYCRLDINMDKILELMEDMPEPANDVIRARRTHCIEMARARLINATVQAEHRAPPEAKSRSANQADRVKHAVGMIMRHRTYDYTCVITGWDPVCAASDGWKLQMGVQSLPKKDKQPFYHVLVNDGSYRYAAEENMVFEPNPVPIAHPEVGKYFHEYCGKYYKMNNARKQQYPDDEEAAIAYVNVSYQN